MINYPDREKLKRLIAGKEKEVMISSGLLARGRQDDIGFILQIEGKSSIDDNHTQNIINHITSIGYAQYGQIEVPLERIRVIYFLPVGKNE